MSDYLTGNLIFGLFGGLGLFLFGMKIMSEGLQKIAGERMRKILAALTNNRLVGTLVGLTVTAIIQSSSATTVMVVGFVNAGLMSLVQAIGVVLGANIGTTVTAQLIAFKISALALPAIGIGAGMKLFSRRLKWVYVGEIILGFGMLFFGMTIMKDAFAPVRNSPGLETLFTMVGDYHLLGVLIGALVTVAVQSSSATIGLTIALASTGAITYDASIALILGENIGTTVTANLAAIGTNLAARRAAFVHFLFNVLGVCYMLLCFRFFAHVVDLLTPGTADYVIRTAEEAARYGMSIGDKPFIARHIANTHTLFNVVNTCVFLPLIGLLTRLATFCIQGQDEVDQLHLKYLDNRVLNTPPIALGQARAETQRMAVICQEMLGEVLDLLRDRDRAHLASLKFKEDLADLLQKEITDFLVTLSQKSVSRETSLEINALIHIVNDLERVADHCENLWLRAVRKFDNDISFSEQARKELREMTLLTQRFLDFVIAAFERRDKTILEASREMEGEINAKEKALRQEHIRRLNTGECAVEQGLIYIDMVHYLEKIGDHTNNIATALAGE